MKQIIFLALFLLFALPIFAQTVQGGAGICHTNGDPNSVTALTTQDVRSGCFFAVDTTNGTRLWYYKHSATSGARWQLIDLSLTDSDTRLDNPRVSGGNLVFDVLNVKTSTVTGTQTVAVTAIAPVQSVAGSTGISVTPSSGTYTVAPANDLGAVEALATNGLATRTGTDTWAVRTITGTARVAVSNGDGVSGNPTIDLAQQSATTGQVLKWNGTSWAPDADANSGGTVTSVGLTAPAAGITVSNSPVTGAGTMGLALANDLSAVEGISGTGVAVRTGTDTWTTRSVTAGTGISVTNGDGVSGNIVITNTAPATADTLYSTVGVSPTLVTNHGSVIIGGTNGISVSGADSETIVIDRTWRDSLFFSETTPNQLYRIQTRDGKGTAFLNKGTGIGFSYSTAGNNQTLTISAETQATDLTFSGVASPFTLNSSSGTDVTFAEGAGISITRSSNELTIAYKEVSAKSQADAATQGVAVGGYFYASIDNTMGMAPGTKIRRMY